MSARHVVLLLPLAACSSDAPSDTPQDAAVAIDAATSSVVEVACPASVPLAVDVPDAMDAFVFTPAANPALPVGSIVKFTTHRSHNVVPNTIRPTDPGLRVDYNTTKCLQFTKSGAFGFNCQPHGFAATITIQ